MPPLGENGSRSDAPSGASRSPASLLPRSWSPRVHSGDWTERIAESGYAAAYPGGSTSWLRIEAHIQHLQELLNQPEIEGGGGPSTRLLEGRRSEPPLGVTRLVASRDGPYSIILTRICTVQPSQS
jgi:hypothetical protein